MMAGSATEFFPTSRARARGISRHRDGPGPNRTGPDALHAIRRAAEVNVMWMPPGTMPLREAVIRTAEQIAPNVDVRAYLAQDVPNAEKMDPLTRALVGMSFDPFDHAVGGRGDDPAWLALEAARAAMLQALGDGQIAVTVKTARGELIVMPSVNWRAADAPEFLRREAVFARANQQSFLVHDQPFVTWLDGEQAGASPFAVEAESTSGRLLNRYFDAIADMASPEPPPAPPKPSDDQAQPTPPEGGAKVRKGGADYRLKDDPLAHEMRRLVETGEADSANRAAWMVEKRAAGSGSPESKVKRLLARYAFLFRADQD